MNDENQCCVRVFNRRFPVIMDYKQLYHSIDVSAYMMLLVRGAVAMTEQEGAYKVRGRVTSAVATVLATYRNKLCSKSPICRLGLKCMS